MPVTSEDHPSAAGGALFPDAGAGPDSALATDTGAADWHDDPKHPRSSASLSPAERVVPTWTDPTAARAADLIGGPLGRHASVGRAVILTPLRVCLIMAICALIGGWLFKAACIQQDDNGSGGVSLDQSGERPWLAACYNDVVPLYGSRGFDRPRQFPYSHAWIEVEGSGDKPIWDPADVQDNDGQRVVVTAGRTVQVNDGDFIGTPDDGYSEVVEGQLVPVDIEDRGQVRYLEYPVLTGLFQWGVSWANYAYLNFARTTGAVPVPLDVAAYFTIGAIFLGLLYLWAVASTAKIARRRIWDTALMCLSPLLVVHAFTNWDAVAIALAAAGMLAWARRHPTLAGVLFGLGMAAKLYPIIFDVVDAHTYGNPLNGYNIPTTFRRIMRDKGLDKPIWITESNVLVKDDPKIADDDPPSAATMDEQASYVIENMALALAAGVQRYSIYKMKRRVGGDRRRVLGPGAQRRLGAALLRRLPDWRCKYFQRRAHRRPTTGGARRCRPASRRSPTCSRRTRTASSGPGRRR